MAESSIKQVLDRNRAAVNAQDIEAYLAHQQPDVEFVLPGGVTVRGRDQLRQYTEAQWTAFPDAKLTFGMQVLSDAGGSAATEVTFTGTHTGPMQTPSGTLAPTGRTVQINSVSLLRIKDGLVASERVFFDQLDLITQLGIDQSETPFERIADVEVHRPRTTDSARGGPAIRPRPADALRRLAGQTTDAAQTERALLDL